MDEMERELRNLELVDTSDNINKTMRVRRRLRNSKDFFSATEYGIYAVNQVFELEYYKKRRKSLRQRRTMYSLLKRCLNEQRKDKTIKFADRSATLRELYAWRRRDS